MSEDTYIPYHYRSMAPEIRTALDNYALHHQEAGGFVMAALRNDLVGAITRADLVNRGANAMLDMCWYLANELPAPIWGDDESVDTWLAGCDHIQHDAARCFCLCHKWEPPS